MNTLDSESSYWKPEMCMSNWFRLSVSRKEVTFFRNQSSTYRIKSLLFPIKLDCISLFLFASDKKDFIVAIHFVVHFLQDGMRTFGYLSFHLL